MTQIVPQTILAVFVLFCRIAGCLSLMPGFSSERVPVTVRLFLAVATTLALSPLLLDKVMPIVSDLSLGTIVGTGLSETATGALIGFMGRLFFIALETFAVAIAMATGLGNILAPAIEENEALPSIATLVTLSATVLIFATNQHWEVLRGLAASYDVLPVDGRFAPRFALSQASDLAARTFMLGLRISSPFLIFSIVVNVAIGLANKLVPSIPVYFISAPFVIAAGLFLIYVTSKEFLDIFFAGFAAWLTRG